MLVLTWGLSPTQRTANTTTHETYVIVSILALYEIYLTCPLIRLQAPRSSRRTGRSQRTRSYTAEAELINGLHVL